ncbi:hypothetical protein A8924_6049 [Saccharopolyspora erythraea NRRL 2338]|uniref:Uncharacterized protein n=2 Tax=Saccharopolyspora erythraea TaxID=1836 RepID=A4FLG6_SACEN|nr:hypothetical protein A8924_6049 [Saccharopolyspora erythraea NRRL 2338]CAM04891.1 hypothetical protein SACE_5706 [Saccharopolyspora erythraea NRRL 2338]
MSAPLGAALATLGGDGLGHGVVPEKARARLLAALLSVLASIECESRSAAQDEWDAAVAGMRENVREMHRLLVTAHGNQASAVRANSRIWQV